MNEEDAMKVVEDLQRLKNMNTDDSAEIVKTYHTTITQEITECIKSIEAIMKLSPATVLVTETSFIIAERDFISDVEGNEKPLIMGIVGLQKNVAKLIEQIWDKCPEAFEKVCEKKGYFKK